MKNQKLYIITTWLLLLTLSITSCSDFFDINTSKDTPAEVNPEQLLPVVVFYSSQLCYDHAEYGVYLSQALTTGGRSQTSSYAYKAGWELLSMNRHPQWRRHFYDIGANGTEMIKAAEKIDSKNYILIGRTIILASTLLTTDAFGDIPRSQLDISNSPTYDTQESVYEWMNKEVDDLLSKLGKYKNFTGDFNFDDRKDFYDDNHMNQKAVVEFNEKFIEYLKTQNIKF